MVLSNLMKLVSNEPSKHGCEPRSYEMDLHRYQCSQMLHVWNIQIAFTTRMIQGASGQIFFALWPGTGVLLLSRSHMYYSSIVHSVPIVIFWVSLIVRHGVEDYETLKCPNPWSMTIFAKLKTDQTQEYQSSAYLKRKRELL